MVAVVEDQVMVRLEHQEPPFRLVHLRDQLE